MLEQQIVTFSGSPELLNLVNATIFTDLADFPGVHIAALNLADDFARVTRRAPSSVTRVGEAVIANADAGIIVGTIKSNHILQRLEKDGKLDFSDIRGKWESFVTAVVDNPFDGCRKALIIAGSDKRGAIFGTYTLSEQIGVSPWYWWADITPKLHREIYARPVTMVRGEPSVRYRGIFINDEAPSLTGWVREKFGSYNAEFYKKVFELLLRLKANFLWPAMWPGYPNPGASFFVDDTRNQITAEEYGIAVSTSHHEPMQRLSNEWFADNPDGSWNWITNKRKIIDFFHEGARRARGCESYFTLGMRGEYDRKMAVDDPVEVVRDVIRSQRSVIKDIYGEEDAVPQLLALYKEVQEQYEGGQLEVPDDVTLLFADDNFGSIRRLPSGTEVRRRGGAGIYYHFEYVGVPRSYKWLNSNSLGKTWHQLREAYGRHARQIWVFNVGDIKPIEVPLTLAMTLAWDINSIAADGIVKFYNSLAHREFGPEISYKIGLLWQEYNRLVSLRRHEHIEPQTFSLLHHNEAEAVLERWRSALAKAETLYQDSPIEQRAGIFELLLHPIKASYLFVALQITLGRNRLYAHQRRNSANTLARQVLDLFEADYSLSEEFHAILNGRWKHMMRQPHYGFGDTWHAPSRDMISGLCYVQQRQDSNPIVGQMGIAVEGHEGVRPGRTNEESDRTHPSRRDLVPGLTLGAMTRYGPKSRWFDIFTRGSPTIRWTAGVPYDWIQLSTSAGMLVPGEDDVRVEITIAWNRVPTGFDEEVLIDVRSGEGDFEQIHLPIIGRQVPDTFRSGYVEADGCVSIPAPMCSVKPPYRVLPETGRSQYGSVCIDGVSTDTSACLTCKVYVFSATQSSTLLLYFNMTLELDPAEPMLYEIGVDGFPVQEYRLLKEQENGGELPQGWFQAVQDCVWVRRHELSNDVLHPGDHTLRIKLKHTNIILEKVVVDLGKVSESYLGPPASFFV